MTKNASMVVCAAVLLFSVTACDRGSGGDRPSGEESPSEVIEGTFQARIPRQELRRGYGPLPRGIGEQWTLTLSDDLTLMLQSEEFRLTEPYHATEDEIFAKGKPAPGGPYNCFEGSRRLVGEDEGIGVYSYTLTESHLELREKSERCPLRAFFMTRRWARVDGTVAPSP